jgi:hypothetical protein
MRPVIGIMTVIVVLVVSLPVTGQAARVVAIADFADESTQGTFVDAPRLAATLARLLTVKSKGRLRTVEIADVRAATRARGYSAHDLDYPSKAAEIAQAVGAEWLITGRWTYMESDAGQSRLDERPFSDAAVGITIRVTDARTRRVLFEGAFWDSAHGVGPRTLLLWAAEGALQKVAARILDLEVSGH